MDGETYRELVRLDQAHWVHPLNHPAVQEMPIVYERGDGIYLFGADGKRYIDALSGLWNVAVGHGRTELADAAAEQMRRLGFNSNYAGYANEPAIRLAAKLLDLTYDNMSGVFLANTGSDSNETNFKAARFYWEFNGKPEKNKIVSRAWGYHGTTLGAMSATGMTVYWDNFEPRNPEIVAARREGACQAPSCRMNGQCNGCLDAIVETIERLGPARVAAVLSEPVQGAGGVFPPEDDYFPRLRELCNHYEILLIADEVITGFGRTGTWFALDHWGVQPDLVSVSKAITSGYLPFGAAIWSQKVHETIAKTDPNRKFMHAYTTSGHPVGSAVALRNLQIIEEEHLVENAARRGAQLLAGLQSLAEMAHVGHVRGLGLMCAFELLRDPENEIRFDADLMMGAQLIEVMKERGLVSRFRNDHVVFAPPLIISTQQVDEMLEIIRESVKAVTAGA